ncbi:MAG: PTS fructose transporter subunit IIA [Burkholderiales bacterium]|nr:PTS fructose transporter subunit IIA [Burkholderiales bacterium]
MIGILLITHGKLGDAFIQCVTHVLGRRPEAIDALGVAGDQSPRDLLPCARSMVEALDQGQGVLILTDLFGATPANLACKLLVPGRVEAVAGVNVPALLRALTYRSRDMETLLKRVVLGGCEGVFHIEPDARGNPGVASSPANEGMPASLRQ